MWRKIFIYIVAIFPFVSFSFIFQPIIFVYFHFIFYFIFQPIIFVYFIFILFMFSFFPLKFFFCFIFFNFIFQPIIFVYFLFIPYWSRFFCVCVSLSLVSSYRLPWSDTYNGKNIFRSDVYYSAIDNIDLKSSFDSNIASYYYHWSRWYIEIRTHLPLKDIL